MMSRFPQDLVPASSSPLSRFTFMFSAEHLSSWHHHPRTTVESSPCGEESVVSSLTQCNLSMLSDHIRCLHSIRAEAAFMLAFVFWLEGPWVCTLMFSLHFADTFDRTEEALSRIYSMEVLQRQNYPFFLSQPPVGAERWNASLSSSERCLHLRVRRAKISPSTGDVCPPTARRLSWARKGRRRRKESEGFVRNVETHMSHFNSFTVMW